MSTKVSFDFFSHVFCFAAALLLVRSYYCRCCSKIKRCETGPLVCAIRMCSLQSDTSTHAHTLDSFISCVFGSVLVCVCKRDYVCSCMRLVPTEFKLANATIITATSSPSDKPIASHALHGRSERMYAPPLVTRRRVCVRRANRERRCVARERGSEMESHK